MKLLIIGFDAMDYYFAKDIIGKKSLPLKIKKLKSRIPLTGPAWCSIYFGTEADTHGVSDYWGRSVEKSNAFEPMKEFAFWEIIKKRHFKVFVDNLPTTRTGLPFAKDKRKDLALWVDRPEEYREKLTGQLFQKTFERVKKNNFSLIEEYAKKNVDLMFVQFSLIDRMLHVFDCGEKETELIYAHCFEIVERMERALRPENLLVISDHGFYPQKNRGKTGLGDERNANQHLTRIDGCCIMNSNAERFLESRGCLKNYGLWRKPLYDWAFSKSSAREINSYRLLKAYYLLVLLGHGRIKTVAKYLLQRFARPAFSKKSWQIDIQEKYNWPISGIKHRLSYGIEQTALFKPILEMFGIKDFPDIRKAKIKPAKQRLSKRGMRLAEERLRALGYI